MKFEFTANYKLHPITGKKAFQIRALVDFGNVKAGDLGGYLSKDVIADQDIKKSWWAFEGGTIWGGTIGGTATIRGGTIRGGTIWGGTIWGGTIGGTATIRGGTIWGGTIWGGTIWGGTIGGGTIGGTATIRGGTIWGGTIGGTATIRGGTIWGGTIGGTATIRGGKDIFVAMSVGSEFGALTATRNEDGSLCVNRGCFNGTLDEFRKAVKEKHGSSKVAKEYKILCDYIELRFKEQK